MQLVCLANLFFMVVSANKASVSSNSVEVIRNRAELNCCINENNSVQWKYTSWNTKSSTEINLYFSGIGIVTSMRSRYRIDKTIPGYHNLIIDSVDLDHAGRYRCISAAQPLISDTQLTVLGSRPVCAANNSERHVDGRQQTQRHLTLRCSINFAGNGTPVFRWSKTNRTNNLEAKTIPSDKDGILLTTTSSITESLQANDSGVTFQCQITFQMPNNSHGNIYEYTWNYILYGPRNLSIVRQKDRLVCSADGNPTPVYRWTDIETNISVEESVYILNLTNDQELVLDCTATNIFATEKINYTIKGTGTANDSGGAQGASDFPVTALAIGALLVLLLIIAAIVVSCVVRRSRLKDDASDRPDVALNTDSSPYDEVVFSSDRTSNYILEEYRLPGRSDGFTITDNDVYSEVSKPKGRSNGKSGGDPGEKSRPIQTQTRAKKNFIGADGTEYAELSGVKPTDRKGEIPRPPAFSRVDVYASIDHNGRAPPPPPKF